MSARAAAEVARPDLDAVKSHAGTWADELATYEAHKRHRTGHPDLYEGPQMRVFAGEVATRERAFDPILQKFRNTDTESGLRAREKEATQVHLNTAYDVQLLREQPFDILTNGSKLEGHPQVQTHGRPMDNARRRFPETFVDYNIVSNLSLQDHHWDHPDARPKPLPQPPKERRVAGFLQKDFNIITNRYLEDHAQKTADDKELRRLKATASFRERNRLDPLLMKYTDEAEQERVQIADQAHELEIVERAQAQQPPSIKHRPTAYYNPVTHEVADEDMLRWIDLAEDERKERFKNRFIVEHNLHVADMNQDQIDHERRLNRIQYERYSEPIKRGYCILTNKPFKGSHNAKRPYLPRPVPAKEPWELAKTGVARPSSTLSRANSAPVRGSACGAPPAPSIAGTESHYSRPV